MGAWGVKLYDNDVAEDIKNTYKEKLQEGKSNEEVTNEIISDYEYMLEDVDDAPLFWMALADQQWRLGRLLPNVKKQALKWIEKGADLQVWYDESEKLGNQRKKVLEELSLKLNSSQPPEKKIYKRRYYRCPWKIGDVFAYKIESDLSKEHDLYGKYIIFQKASEVLERVSDYLEEGHICPIIRCWISDEPKYSNELKGKTNFIRSSNRINKNGTFNYAYGMTTTSSRSIPKKITYLGNYELNIPKDDGGDIEDYYRYFSMVWKHFEDFLIKDYLICILGKYNCYNDFKKKNK